MSEENLRVVLIEIPGLNFKKTLHLGTNINEIFDTIDVLMNVCKQMDDRIQGDKEALILIFHLWKNGKLHEMDGFLKHMLREHLHLDPDKI